MGNKSFLIKIVLGALAISFLLGGSRFLVFGQSDKKLAERIEQLERIIGNRGSATAFKEAGNFVIYYNRSTKKEGKLAASLAVSEKKYFCELFDCQVTDLSVYVYILSDRKEFEKKFLELTKERASGGTVAFTFFNEKFNNGAYELTDNTIKVYTYPTGDLVPIRASLVHEFGHVLLREWLVNAKGARKWPIGIDEGMAKLLSGDFLTTAFSFDNSSVFLPLKDFLSLNFDEISKNPQMKEWISKGGAHEQAASFMYYLLTRPDGLAKLRFLIKNFPQMKTDQDVLDLIARTTKTSIDQLEKDWLKWVGERPRDASLYAVEARRTLPPEIWKLVVAANYDDQQQNGSGIIRTTTLIKPSSEEPEPAKRSNGSATPTYR